MSRQVTLLIFQLDNNIHHASQQSPILKLERRRSFLPHIKFNYELVFIGQTILIRLDRSFH